MRFEELMKSPSEVQIKCADLDLYEIDELLSDGAQLFPKMTEEMNKDDSDYRPSSEEWDFVRTMGALFDLSEKAFEKEKEATQGDSRRWMKLIRSHADEEWALIKKTTLPVLLSCTEEYECLCKMACLRLNGHSDLHKMEDVACIFALANQKVEETDPFKEVNPLSSAVQCEWARRRLTEKFDLGTFMLPPEWTYSEPVWNMTDDDLIEEMALVTMAYQKKHPA